MARRVRPWSPPALSECQGTIVPGQSSNEVDGEWVAVQVKDAMVWENYNGLLRRLFWLPILIRGMDLIVCVCTLVFLFNLGQVSGFLLSLGLLLAVGVALNMSLKRKHSEFLARFWRIREAKANKELREADPEFAASLNN